MKRFTTTLLPLFALLLTTTAAIAQTVYNTTGTYTRIVPATGTYTLTAVGADGGDSYNSNLPGGAGATIQASFTLNVGDTLTMFVGNNGEDGLIDARAAGGGGGGTAVILNGTHVLIAAGGGGGASRSLAGFGGVANTNSVAGAGASPEGAGGGGFNAIALNPAIGCTSTQGGRQGTLISIGGAAEGYTVSCGTSGGNGGEGFGGGGGANFQTGGGGGGYKGGDGGANSSDGGDGGDSFVNTGVRDGTVVSATAGTNGGSTGDADGSVTFTPAIIQGEANIQGNGVSISDGDNSPSPADHTYFGVVPNGSSVNRTFTIQNLHVSENMSVGAISLTGTDATEFSISGITFPVTLAPSGSTTFVVTLNSTSSSIRTAKVNIMNSDLDEFIYDFTVQGNSNPPTVTYTPLTNAGSTSNRILTGFATITDDFGVSSGASLPRFYFKKSTDANAFVGNTSADNGWKYVAAGNSTSPYDFTIDYAILFGGSAATNDVIQYFVVAQDDDNQLTSLPTGAAASGNPPVQNINAAATTPNAYTILSPFSGTVTVGSGGTYPNLTGANGLFADISGPGLNGNLTATIISDVTEDGTHALNQWAETGGSNYTVTIQPDAATMRTISGDVAVANGMIRLDGADRVRIDGRFNGAGRYLTFSNTNTGQPTITFINDAMNDSLRNCIVQGVATSATGGVIFFGGTTGTTGNDNNLIDSCDVRDGATTPTNGIYSLGTTTTTAQNNSGNVISNCNIFNFYGSAFITTGILMDNGSTDWTIAGNSFYQTTSRAAVAGYIIPIYLATAAGNNFQVTSNFIGGSAPNAGSTAWTTTGGAGYLFIGIQVLVGATTPSSVQGNTVRNIVWNTSANTASPPPGIWSGINVNSGSANIGTVTGNTIGSGTGTGSVSITTSATGGTTFGISSTSSGTVAIANNTIGSITTNGSTTSISASLIGIQVTAGTNTISNNTVGSTTTANSLNASNSSTSTPGQAMTGIQSSSTSGATITNNTVANLNNNYAGTQTTGQIRGIVTSSGSNTITGNTVRNLSTTSLNANAATLQSVYGIIQTSTIAGQTVSQNVVHSLSSTAPTQNVSVTGIYFAGSTTTAGTIARNLVHSLSISSTSATSVMNGMQFVGGRFNIQNSMVRVGIDASGTSTAGASIVRGIYDNGTTANRNFYHNSVYVGGAQASLAANTFAFISTGTSNARSFQNNIFFNARGNSGGSGKHFAVQYGGTTVNPTGLTASNNIFYASGTGGVLGFYNSADRTTLADWQAATGKDASSINADPLFVNPTAGTPDLHVQNNTPAEASGVVVATVTDDFDGETRSGLSPTDVGADAGDFGIGMSYTLLTNGSTTNRTVTNFATIGGPNGISGGANLPRFYFKKSTDADAFVGNTSADNGWKYVAANNGASPYSFTIDYFIISGGSVVAGDVIQYFVVAQDDANNFRSSPYGAGFAANPPVQNVNAKPSAGINSYTILATLSGAMTVGAAGDYTTLTGAGGLFAGINNSILIGNLTITITGDLTEDGANGLNQWVEEGAGNYTVTIQPADTTMKTISSSVANWFIRLNGVDRVTIDGRFSGAGRFLTIRQTNSSFSTIAFSNDASNNTIRNCVIEGATTGVVFFTTGATTGNDNNLITENHIRDRSDAAGVPNTLILSGGTSAAVANSNNTISNNEIFNFTGNAINTGSNNASENWIISGNTIYQTTERASSITGIFVNAIGTNTISGNTIRDFSTTSFATGIFVQAFAGNTTIARNRIYNFPSAAGNTNRQIGIQVNHPSGDTVTLANNQIILISSFTNDQQYYGIWDLTQSGGTFNAYYNSVVIGGTGSGANSSWAFYRSLTGNSTLRNNIFFNNRSGGTGSHFAAGQVASAGSFLSNYNLFVGTGATATDFFDRGTSSTPSPVSFATWRSGTAQDTFSYADVAANISAANLFVDPATGNLNINTANAESWYVNGKGVAGSASGSIMDDYAATGVRGVTFGTPTDIGADEFTPDVGINPSCATESAPPAVSTTTTYTIAGRVIGTIAWGASGTPPSSVCFQHYSGTIPPPFITGQANFIRSYWEITATGGSGYTYDLTLYYTEAEINAIVELNLGIAKRDGSNPWVNQGGAPVPASNMVFVGGLDSFSQFTLNDQTNPLPVQLASFTGVFVNRAVRLNWRTISEVNNYGFYVQQRSVGVLEWWSVENSFVAGHGTTNEPHDYSFTHTNVAGGSWQYRLKQVDLDGTIHFTEPINVSSPTSVKEVAPREFALKQNYPNPFNPETNIKFSVEETGRATLEIFNLLGQKVATLFDNVVEAGYYQTVKVDGAHLASGMYLYRLQTGNYVGVKKLVLTK